STEFKGFVSRSKLWKSPKLPHPALRATFSRRREKQQNQGVLGEEDPLPFPRLLGMVPGGRMGARLRAAPPSLQTLNG
uniref:hypothetical protein n=1 Tax=Xanthomonas axonopodis TaxID=53413 RepID=UPI000ADCA8BD